jgi:hypothetical protein
MVSAVTGTSTLRAPFAIDFLMTDGPPASHNENYLHYRLQETVEVRHNMLDNIVCFATSDFGGAQKLEVRRSRVRYAATGCCPAPSYEMKLK